MGSRYDQIDLAAVATEWRDSLHAPPPEPVRLPTAAPLDADSFAGAVVADVDIDAIIDPPFAGFGPRERLDAVWEAAWNAKTAAAAAGVSPSTLRRWATDGVVPRSAWFPGRPRRWTFADAVRARTVARLRQAGASLAEVFRTTASIDWERPATFAVAGRSVVVADGDHVPLTTDGQLVFATCLSELADQARAAVAHLEAPATHAEPRGLRMVLTSSS